MPEGKNPSGYSEYKKCKVDCKYSLRNCMSV